MEMITGPQSTPQQREYLVQAARRLHLTLLTDAAPWPLVTALHCLPGWEMCSIARADVTIAEALCLPVHETGSLIISSVS